MTSTNCPAAPETVLRTPSWRVLLLGTYELAERYGRHAGWCTKERGTWEVYYGPDKGQLYVGIRKGKRRASWQLFARKGRHPELARPGNRLIALSMLCNEEPELREWLMGFEMTVCALPADMVTLAGGMSITLPADAREGDQIEIRNFGTAWAGEMADVPNARGGDTFYDRASGQLHVYDGKVWVPITDGAPDD